MNFNTCARLSFMNGAGICREKRDRRKVLTAGNEDGATEDKRTRGAESAEFG